MGRVGSRPCGRHRSRGRLLSGADLAGRRHGVRRVWTVLRSRRQPVRRIGRRLRRQSPSLRVPVPGGNRVFPHAPRAAQTRSTRTTGRRGSCRCTSRPCTGPTRSSAACPRSSRSTTWRTRGTSRRVSRPWLPVASCRRPRSRVRHRHQLHEGRHPVLRAGEHRVAALRREVRTPELGFGSTEFCALAVRTSSASSTASTTTSGTRGPIPTSLALLPEDISGKAACKADLLRAFGLPECPNLPVVGITSRLVHQKGFDLVTSALARVSPSADPHRDAGRGRARRAGGIPRSWRRRRRTGSACASGTTRGSLTRSKQEPTCSCAVPLRAVRTDADVQPALRHGADRPSDRRPRRHRRAPSSRLRQRHRIPLQRCRQHRRCSGHSTRR